MVGHVGGVVGFVYAWPYIVVAYIVMAYIVMAWLGPCMRAGGHASRRAWMRAGFGFAV